MQKRLYAALLLREKLPPGVPGGTLITQDIDRQTLQVAYLAQYPQRGREIVHLGLIGAGGIALVAAYYLLWWGDAALLGLLIVLGAIAVTARGSSGRCSLRRTTRPVCSPTSAPTTAVASLGQSDVSTLDGAMTTVDAVDPHWDTCTCSLGGRTAPRRPGGSSR